MKRAAFLFFVLFFALFTLPSTVLANNTDIVIKEIQGLVQVQRQGDSDWVKPEEGSMVTSGDKIRSFLESSALLVFPNGSEFRLRENTSLDVKDISENEINKTAQRALKLNLGSLHYKVPPKKEKSTEFKIYSSTSIVGITGTEGVVTAKGEGKSSENILMEGATYDTDVQGRNGYYQKSGNVYKNDGVSGRLFSADVQTESILSGAIDQEYLDLIKGAVANFKNKHDEGFRIGKAEDLIKKAFFYLEKREYDLVRQTVDRVNILLEKPKKVKISLDLDNKIAEILRTLEEKDGEGYDVAVPSALLAKAQSLKQSGEFANIKQILTQAEKELALLAEQDLTQGNTKTFISRYQDVQKRVLEKGQQGFAVNENKALLRQAKIFYEQDEKPMAYLFLKEAEDKLSLVLKNVSDAFMAKITRLEEEVAAKRAASYPTKEFELRLEKAKSYIKEEDFLKARELVRAVEDGLVTLRKSISADWQLKIAELKKNVTYERSAGYDLNEIPGFIGEIEEYQAKGDLINLEIVYKKAIAELAKLKLPGGFETNWKDFLKQKEAKAAEGYNVKTANDLSVQIQTAVDTGDVKSARTFLAQAKKTLRELKDQEPPKVQVISFEETEEAIKIEGYASDNTKIKNVSVNNTNVEWTKEGKFQFDTVPHPSLKKLSVLATDIEGNISAPVVLPLAVKGEPIDQQAVLRDVVLEYSENTFVVKGKFVAGGKVRVGTAETVCDKNGQFKVVIKPDKNKTRDSVSVAGILSDEQTTEETVLTIQDQWAPRIEIAKVSYDNNFVPALNVEPLTYDDNKFSVSGQVVLSQMANIEGRAYDLGGQIESLKIGDMDVDIREDGLFNATLTINRSLTKPTVKLVAVDKSGNSTETQVALDATWHWPSLRINNVKTFQRSLGKFSKEISLTADATDVNIVLEDSAGETIVSKRLPVAAVLPPELEIQGIRYEGDKILISGRSTADGTVSEKDGTIFQGDVEVLKDAVFTLTADYPPVDQEIILVAANIEGKLSEEVKVIVGPPKDIKAPIVYLSAPEKDDKGVIVKGFVEDDSGIAKVTVGGVVVNVSDEGAFVHNIGSAKNLNFVEVMASDIFKNETKRIIALADKEEPQITIDTWEAKDGRLVISGKATDNIAVKQVRLNDMPIATGEKKELAFSYNGALKEDSADARIVAVDLMNNEAQEGPREIIIPTDDTAPKGQAIGMKYGSPMVYVSGKVVDPAGVRAVYVNGEEVELFEDGTFNVKISIDVGLPKLEMESPAYDQGKLIIVGKASVGDFNPAKITVEAEDLSGNRGVLSSQTVAPYQLNELEVSVDGNVLDVTEDGSFRFEQPMVLGQRAVDIVAIDPFDNRFSESLALEDKKPVLYLEPLQYNAERETVLLTGKAEDAGSGLYTVSVNGIRTELGSDGSFTYKTTFNQGSLNVIATDYIGNETSLTKEVNPPDVWPPVFSLSVTPIPAIVGDPVYVEIAALDSKTGVPEILKGAPEVKADADGTPIALTVAGEGANYMATLETTGLNAALVTIAVEGEDAAGNKSSETEGTAAFALVKDDMIAPSFTIETVPSPMELGAASTVKVLSSEDLKEIPSLTATMPSGTTNTLTLTEAGGGTYQASLTVSGEEGIGMASFQLSGGEDLSGNVHDVTEAQVDVIAPLAVAELPLNINLIDFVTERFVLNGQTASEAIVHIEAGRMVQDIVADAQGMFRFERPVSLMELEEMYRQGPSIRVRLKAHNYAGFESRQKFLEIPLPPLPELGGVNFEIRLSPVPVGQGQMINISVDPLKSISDIPKGFIYFPDGRRASVSLQGSDIFNAQYMIPEDAALGTAMFEVVSADIRESVMFEIGLSGQWMQRLNKYDFFRIRTSRDPLIIGEPVEFFVETMGDLPQVPRLEIRLPNGRRDSIPLSGSQRFFQGSYTAPADVVPGMAELILNPGTPQEIHRPYGVEDKFSEGDFADVFLFANPNPLIGGEPYNVNVSFSQQIFFKPRLVLKLQNGRIIEMPLEGSAPNSKFMARGTLPSDVETGLAKFVLSDDQGVIIDRFPAQISASFSTSTGKDIFITPGMLRRMETATIQLNSITPVYGRIEARVSFPDGTRKVVLLEGTEMLRKGVFTVPDYVPVGTVTISVFDQYGMVGNINAQVVDYDMTGEPVHIYLNNPDFQPYDYVRLNVETNWPLSTIPKAELIWDGGSLRITLTGQVPGNRFTGEFMAPKDLITHGRIEVRDAQDAMLGDLSVGRGPEGEGEIIVTPMPPVIGQPLSIKVVAPSIVDSALLMRLIFDDDTRKELNAYGPIPGDTFIASLALLEKPLRMIEIVHEGVVVESIPVEYLSTTNFDFMVNIQDPMVVPCDITDVIVRANSDVPFTPYLSADFNGRIIDIPLSKMSPMEFLGRMSVPCDVSFTNYNMRLFNPQGKLLWQRNFISDMTSTSSLQLHAMPLDANSVELSWNMISGVDGYEIRYGETAALGRTISAGNVSNFVVPDLTTGKTYFFKVAARKSYQDVMVSDIINTVVGGTTLELNPNFNITDNDINLYWAEYPGADKYRVQWGEAVGVYPNMRETTAPNYFIQDLTTGAGYYVKVQALQNGIVIGESRDIYIYIEQFVSSGGEIYFNPDPPTVGSQLYISMHFYEDLPFIPKVVVRLTDRDVTLVPTGSYRDYTATLTAAEFNTAIEVIDVLDTTGNIIAAREVGGGTYAGEMVPIEVTPDPPVIGNSVQVSVNFPDEVSFIPRLVVEFASGFKEYDASQGAYMRFYEWSIPVADMTSSVLYMKVVNPDTYVTLGDISFSDQTAGYEDVPFVVVPNPTIIEQSVSMTLDTDIVVSLAPRLRIYYEYASTQEVTMTGTLPGQHFIYNIGSLSSRITTIDIIDPTTDTVKYTWLPAESNDPTSCEIIVPYDPPLVNQTLNLKAQFPGVVSYTPKVRVYFTNNDVKYYTFPQSPGLSMYEIYIPAADITTNVDHIQIWNEAETLMVGERYFSTTGVSVEELSVSPAPPVIDQSLDVHVQFNTYVGFVPHWKLHTIDNVYEGTFSAGSGYQVYDQTIPASYLSSKVTNLEIYDDTGNFIANGELSFVYPEDFTCTVTLDPTTPEPYTALTVKADYPSGSVPSYIPWVYIDFAEGGIWEQEFSQAAYMQHYEMMIPNTYITDYVTRIGIGSDAEGTIDCGIDFAVTDTHITDLTASTAEPTVSVPFDVTVTFNQPVSFLPSLILEFADSTRSSAIPFGGSAGQQTYTVSLSASQVTDYVDRIVVVDDKNIEFGYDLVFATQEIYITDLTASTAEPTVSVPFDVTVNFNQPVPFIPRLILEFADATKSPPIDFNGAAGQQTYTANLTASDVTDYVDRVVVIDDNNVEFGYDLVFGAQAAFVIGLNAIDSTHIEVCWPVEAWIDSYQIFYRTDTGSYGSPITGVTSCYTLGNGETLTPGETYYILVEGLVGAAVEQSGEDFIDLTVATVPYPTNVTFELPNGTNGEIKVIWDTVTGVDGYRIYYGTSAEPTTYDEIAGESINNYTLTNLLTSDQYTIRVKAFIGTQESSYDNTVYTYPSSTGGSGGLSASVSSLNIAANALEAIPQQTVIVTNTGTTEAVNVTGIAVDGISGFPFAFSPSTPVNLAAVSGSQTFYINMTTPVSSNGTYNGAFKFFADEDSDGIHDEGVEPVAIVSVNLNIGGTLTFDHIRMTADQFSSPMGSPIFVTLEAMDVSDDLVSAYNTDVTIDVAESAGGELVNSWILSTNGSPGGPSLSTVSMSGGIGNFTVDAQEPETLTITSSLAAGHGSPLDLKFTARTPVGGTVADVVIIGPNRAPINTNAQFWLAVVDSSGKVVTDSTLPLTYWVTGASGLVNISPASPYTLAVANRGQYLIGVSDDTAETVTLNLSDGTNSDAQAITFIGVDKYLVYAPGETFATSFTAQDSAQRFILRAADTSDNVIRSYNETANVSIVSGDNGGNATFPGTITFSDGIAEFVLENSDTPDSIVFNVQEAATPSIETGNVTVTFPSSDTDAPEIIRVVMDTPWIVHIYFDETVDSVSARAKANYTTGVTIDTICWYGDNVTLHLASMPASVSGSFSMDVVGVEDEATNATNITSYPVTMPDVDVQGAAGDVDDWFEIQVSDTSPSIGETVLVTVYHKNVCGYLSGDNAVNAKTPGITNINISYPVGESNLSVHPSNASMSDGKAEFNIVGGSSGEVRISASGAGVTTTEVAIININ